MGPRDCIVLIFFLKLPKKRFIFYFLFWEVREGPLQLECQSLSVQELRGGGGHSLKIVCACYFGWTKFLFKKFLRGRREVGFYTNVFFKHAGNIFGWGGKVSFHIYLLLTTHIFLVLLGSKYFRVGQLQALLKLLQYS